MWIINHAVPTSKSTNLSKLHIFTFEFEQGNVNYKSIALNYY